MTQSTNNTALASIAVLVLFALGVAWYVNTHPTPAPNATSTPVSL